MSDREWFRRFFVILTSGVLGLALGMTVSYLVWLVSR